MYNLVLQEKLKEPQSEVVNLQAAMVHQQPRNITRGARGQKGEDRKKRIVADCQQLLSYHIQ